MTTVRSAPSALRRVLTVLALTGAVILSASAPSWASFSATDTAGATITTGSVAPPADLVTEVHCTGNKVTVTLDWRASTSAQVSGYRVRLYLGEAYQDQATVAATTTSWQGTADRYYVDNYVVTFTVWTLTEYGWTAESARTAPVVC